jgi:putative methyltransferase (TIGR04325 family)
MVPKPQSCTIQKMRIKKYLKPFCPPILIDFFNTILGRGIRFSGIYPSWSAASAYAVGYNSDSILEKVIAATNKVISGEVKFERDGQTFDVALYPFPLIATLLRAAAENDGKLTVLDFGGALGSSYHQCRDFLLAVKQVRWCVVEQPHFAEAGNQYFLSDTLLFFKHMKTVVAEYRPNVILFSGVLQYLPDPYAVLNEAIDSPAEYIVVDRNPFTESEATIISVQKIPKQIIHSSYPVRLFNESEFRQIFAGKYSAVSTFDALDGTVGRGRLKATFKGIVFRKMGSPGSG